MKIEPLISFFDDIVTEEDGHQWSEICMDHLEIIPHKTGYTLDTIKANGTCGIKGCSKKSRLFVDFIPDNKEE